MRCCNKRRNSIYNRFILKQPFLASDCVIRYNRRQNLLLFKAQFMNGWLKRIQFECLVNELNFEHEKQSAGKRVNSIDILEDQGCIAI